MRLGEPVLRAGPRAGRSAETPTESRGVDLGAGAADHAADQALGGTGQGDALGGANVVEKLGGGAGSLAPARRGAARADAVRVAVGPAFRQTPTRLRHVVGCPVADAPRLGVDADAVALGEAGRRGGISRRTGVVVAERAAVPPPDITDRLDLAAVAVDVAGAAVPDRVAPVSTVPRLLWHRVPSIPRDPRRPFASAPEQHNNRQHEPALDHLLPER